MPCGRNLWICSDL